MISHVFLRILLLEIERAINKQSGPLSERKGLFLLHHAGIKTVRWREANNVDAALEAAAQVGYPVAIKSDEGLLHKSDVGGVSLNNIDITSLTDAYKTMATKLGPKVIVGPMVNPGVEIGLGALVDKDFGAMIMLSAGGTMIEVFNEKQMSLVPLDSAAAMKMLQQLKIWPLLTGVRGQQAKNIDALIQLIVNFSTFVDRFSHRIKEIDINPVIVSATEAIAVDALVILKEEV